MTIQLIADHVIGELILWKNEKQLIND